MIAPLGQEVSVGVGIRHGAVAGAGAQRHRYARRFAVQSVFAFTLFAGLTVLLAAVQASRDERRYESAMLRTLGASRGVVHKGILAEFLLLGGSPA